MELDRPAAPLEEVYPDGIRHSRFPSPRWSLKHNKTSLSQKLVDFG